MSIPPDPPNPSPSQTPLFVERQIYRRRRIVDAARALPVLGLMLWWLPLLWSQSDEPMPASSALLYIFLVWIALSLISAGLILALGRRRNQVSDGGERNRM